MKNKKIMIFTGEKSGDLHAAELIKSIHEKKKSVKFYGIGSNAMSSAGAKILINSNKFSVMGIIEVLPLIPFFIKSLIKINKTIKRIKPDLIILIDFPDFNLKIANIAKKLKIPVLYYIAPQIWAWRKYRIKKIKKVVDRFALTLPFEEKIYKQHKINANYVGHPLLDRHNLINEKIIKKNNPEIIIGIFPGSRNKEISKILPTLLKSAEIIKKQIPNTKFIVSKTDSINKNEFNKIIKKYNKNLKAKISNKISNEIFKDCYIILATSGTITLEAALHSVPSIIVYKVSKLTYLIGKILIGTKYIGLVNLILKKEVLPELIQNNASKEKIAKTTISILNDNKKFNKIKQELTKVKKILGTHGSSKKTANIAIQMIK